MNISRKDFEQMKAKYDKEVKKGRTGTRRGGEVKDQTNWVFFDRETLEGLLDKAGKDPKKSGIKFYFTEYTTEIAEQFYGKEAEEYDGRLTLVMSPANLDGDSAKDVESRDGGTYANRGNQCPPKCE
ncbi:molecular chaperone DnaK [Algoriphagus sediminis]|uniref:Molecular chaperone DnaK n=1 Tax=Algoriphagus sediminis TaxID=3057113 RepID=A0ABT7YCP5_9BACT|nr:molecular chaperone DnaK [Algoriphagus sediminis]MDN3204291.1 molecular chaperone DnaK [Algoriphagus sediminis]